MMWVIYHGAGGELLIGTLLIVSFYYRMPDSWRWDFLRLLAIVAGSFVFLSAYLLWWKVAQGIIDIPKGSLLNGKGDAGGDMDRLHFVFGWSKLQLVTSFLRLGNICSAVIAGHYLWFLWRAYGRRG
jgi:hypothetical protein